MAWLRTSPGEDHRRTRTLLPWYVTGQLDAAEVRQVEAHLEACEGCRAELAAERRLRQAILAAPLEAEARAPPRRRAAIAIGAAGAVAASLAAVIVGLSPPRAPAPREVYHTLGEPGAPSESGLVVVFDPQCPEGQMSAVLARAHARIADGPTATGAYVLRVPRAGREAALATLRGAPGVRLVQSLEAPG